VTCVAGCQDAAESAHGPVSDDPKRVRSGTRNLNLRMVERGVFLWFGKMTRMRHDSNAPGRRLGACVCLVAVILLWAPAWAAAFQAANTGCCDGAMCPLHGHAPKKSSGDADAPKDAQPAMCEHHGRKAAMDCSMACCDPKDPVVTGAIVFVLPSPMAISAPLLIDPPTPTLSRSANSFVFDPASPPPRTRS
jgi:hypothetical protein